MEMETARLRVRPLKAADEEALFAVLSDQETMRCLEPTFTREQTRAFLQQVCRAEIPPVYGVEEKVTGLLLGHLIFHPFDERGWELGWVLRRDRWGRGLASELTAAAIARARETKIPSLVLECLPEQTVTRHLAERFGFQIEEGKGSLLRFRLWLEDGDPTRLGGTGRKTCQFEKRVSLSEKDSAIIL